MNQMYIEKPMNYRVKDHTCYYFDDILVYISWTKSLVDSKSLRIRLNKIDGFTRFYDGTRYLVLFWSEKHDYIYDRIRYLIGVESAVTDIISFNSAKIKVDSCDSLQWLFMLQYFLSKFEIKIKITTTIRYF